MRAILKAMLVQVLVALPLACISCSASGSGADGSSDVDSGIGPEQDAGLGEGVPGDFDGSGPDSSEDHSIDDPYDTSRIELVETVHRQGYTADYYENRAYTCGRRGYQTFLVVYPDGLSRDVKRPLWVRMHGGGVGAFDDSGNYVPAEFLDEMPSLDQEYTEKLAQAAFEKGLVAGILAHPAGFRLLLPSMCDHDTYSGVGIPELNNPFSPDENGKPRAADGLLATQAAIDYTRSHYASTHVFLHGTSAGSIGAFSVAYALERKGLRLSGVVSDSHMMGKGLLDNAVLGCMPFPYDPDLVIPKIGPLATLEYAPDVLVRTGEFTVPIYHIWNRGDRSCCGNTEYEYTDDSGQTYSEPGCWHEHKAFHRAVVDNPPGGPGVSVSVELCVNGEGVSTPMACNKHSPTKMSADTPNPPGDQLRGGSDYNRAVLDWVNERLKDPVP
ncbi:MAG: hypothetical protein D6806_03860 [Deltaproteobacteria bacterium]|nr:MAG: hypothetical protein D6806_03860 [Deltaproteobacteria bacterium]